MGSKSTRAASVEDITTIRPVELIHSRYRVNGELGRGGMAVVFDVHDTATGRRVALKRMQPPANEKHERALAHFEREFHTLSQLAHPRIVTAFDYAVDAVGPHYTMELLDGGDLRTLSPLEFRRACGVARDVCSALSLLHSRRLVHRDVSPRNVRCTDDGLAKLIDFGAMAAMGPSRVLLGTPPYTAPELVYQQPLDARTDLYALGATLYYALTGRNAYPAREFSELFELWLLEVPRPSDIVPGIPPALDLLVLDLLQMEPGARPASAAEVMERLSAIDGKPLDDQLLVARAYLSTPRLVGRERPLARARMKMTRALQGNGGAIFVESASGLGRSRLLDACVVEAKLLGATVLRADADDSESGDYGAVRALARQALDAFSEEGLEAARPLLGVLGHVVPDLHARAPEITLEPVDDPRTFRPRLQVALREWFLRLSAVKPIVVAADDVHRVDEPSASLIALLASEARGQRVFVIATAESGPALHANAAIKVLSACASRQKLDILSDEQTEKLLGSVFGQAPHLGLLAHHLHGISGGSPRDVMRLAQHLVDRRLVRYEAGAWSLPAHFDAADLPPDMASALGVRVAALGPAARTLGAAFALCPGQNFSFTECVALCGESGSGEVLSALGELVEAEVLRSSGEHFRLAQSGWEASLRAELPDALTRTLHRRISQIFAVRPESGFRVGQHLLKAAELSEGIRVLAEHAEVSQERTGQNPDEFIRLVQSLPPDWYATYEETLRLCDVLSRPPKDKHMLRSRLAGLVALTGNRDTVHMPELIRELERLTGLADWAELEALEPMPRLMKALEQARDRYAATPESDRVLDPATAIRHLARAKIQGVAETTAALDVAAMRELPSLLPLSPLSPALALIEILHRATIDRLTARFAQAKVGNLEFLRLTDDPDVAGLDPSHRQYMRLGVMNGRGMTEAAMGLASSLEWAERIENDPTFQVNALQIRMLHRLWQGDTRGAEQYRRQVDVLRIQNGARQWFEGTHLLGVIVAHSALEDLTGIKRTAREIDPLAERYPGWVPVRHFALGEYHRARGDLVNAVLELEAGLRLTDAGEHQLWANLAGAHLQAKCASGSTEEAAKLGLEYLDRARSAGLDYVINYLLMPLGVIQARLDRRQEAVATTELAIANFREMGVAGLNLGLAYEARARVASIVRDAAGFDRYCALLGEVYRGGGSAALVAKYERLRREDQYAGVGSVFTPVHPAFGAPLHSDSRVESLLGGYSGAEDRARRALSLLLQQGGAKEGYLILAVRGQDGCGVEISERPVPQAIRLLAREYLASQTEEVATLDTAPSRGTSPSATRTGPSGETYRPILLSHASPTGVVITGAAIVIIARGTRFALPAHLPSAISRTINRMAS